MTHIETLELTEEDLQLEMTDLEDMNMLALSNADGVRIAVAVTVLVIVLCC